MSSHLTETETCMRLITPALERAGWDVREQANTAPLAEQRRIVAKVDELMALCDTPEKSLERAKTTREQFASSVSHSLSS